MSALLSESETKRIMCETVPLTLFSFPLLDGCRPTNCVDFTEMVSVRLLLFMLLYHDVYFTLAISAVHKANSVKC
jgi:hypothetical protein